MTHRVSVQAPALPSAASLRTSRAVRGLQLGAFAEAIAHLEGAQTTEVCRQVWPYDELPAGAGATTLRIGHRAGANAAAVVVRMIPWGYTGVVPGSVQLAGAEGEDTLPVTTAATASGGAAALLEDDLIFVKPVASPGAWNEHVLTLTDVRPHSLVCYEVPLSVLRGSDEHVDWSIASTGLVITDEMSASNPRGWRELLSQVTVARTECRRHLVGLAWPYPAGGGGGVQGSAGYLIGSAAAGDGLRTVARDVRGALTETPARARVYVAAVGASTFDLSISTGAAGSPYAITGINAAGWWPAAATGQAISCLASEDTLKVQVTRTAGAGNLEVDSVVAWEDT